MKRHLAWGMAALVAVVLVARADDRKPEGQSLDERGGKGPLAPSGAVEAAAPRVRHLEVDGKALERLLLYKQEVLPIRLAIPGNDHKDDSRVLF